MSARYKLALVVGAIVVVLGVASAQACVVCTIGCGAKITVCHNANGTTNVGIKCPGLPYHEYDLSNQSGQTVTVTCGSCQTSATPASNWGAVNGCSDMMIA